jgi:hypothetical protein
MAPIITTPWIALAPDIRGVCRIAGTWLITSIPRKIDRITMNIASLCSKKKPNIFSIY